MTLKLIMLSLLPMYCFSQNCSVKEEKDIEGNVKKETKSKWLKGGMSGITCNVLDFNGQKKLGITFALTSPTNIYSTDYLVLKLENEEVIKLIADQGYSPTHSQMGWVLTPRYDVSPEFFDKIKTKKVTSFKITYDSKYVEYEVKNKNQGNLMTLARCL